MMLHDASARSPSGGLWRDLPSPPVSISLLGGPGTTCTSFFSDGCTGTSLGGNPKVSHPSPYVDVRKP